MVIWFDSLSDYLFTSHLFAFLRTDSSNLIIDNFVILFQHNPFHLLLRLSLIKLYPV